MSNKLQVTQLLPKLQRVKEYEKYYSALCPFHDDTSPSFLLYKDGWFRCLGCGRTGDLYSLYRVVSGWGSRSHGIGKEVTDFHVPRIPKESEWFAIDAHETLMKFSESLAWYLRIRGIENQIIPQKIGWYNGWYTFPVYNYDGDYKGMILRAGQHIQEATKLRYVIKTTAKTYFPDWYLARSGSHIVVTFGILDAISLTALRIPACSTIHGKTLSTDDLEWARKPVILFPDKDEVTKARRYYKELGWRGRVLDYDYPDELKDPNDLVNNGYSIEVMNAVERMR